MGKNNKIEFILKGKNRLSQERFEQRKEELLSLGYEILKENSKKIILTLK